MAGRVETWRVFCLFLLPARSVRQIVFHPTEGARGTSVHGLGLSVWVLWQLRGGWRTRRGRSVVGACLGWRNCAGIRRRARAGTGRGHPASSAPRQACARAPPAAPGCATLIAAEWALGRGTRGPVRLLHRHAVSSQRNAPMQPIRGSSSRFCSLQCPMCSDKRTVPLRNTAGAYLRIPALGWA